MVLVARGLCLLLRRGIDGREGVVDRGDFIADAGAVSLAVWRAGIVVVVWEGGEKGGRGRVCGR